MELQLLSPTSNTEALCIAPEDVKKFTDIRVCSLYGRIKLYHNQFSEDHLKRLKLRLNELCQENNILIVEDGITYGLQKK